MKVKTGATAPGQAWGRFDPAAAKRAPGGSTSEIAQAGSAQRDNAQEQPRETRLVTVPQESMVR